MKQKVTNRLLILLSFLLLACAALPASASDYIAANHTADNGRPYYIMVNRARNTVTVYALDDEGYYTVPVKAMVCSVGRQGHATPLGSYSIGGRWTWLHMFDDSYGQYATQISGNILFHSVCYTERDPSTLMADEYNRLGSPASLGCVRLQTVDAKWIFDHCASGTKVTIYDGTEPGPLGKPDKLVARIDPELDNGWDPTDPRAENPWALPFTDVVLGAWYYSDIRYVYEAGLLAGTSQDAFSPNALMTGGMMVQALCRMSGESGDPDALSWARANHLLDGPAFARFDPDEPLTRQELALMLYRYETIRLGRLPQNSASLSGFPDGAGLDPAFRAAVGWAVGCDLLRGTAAGALLPEGHADRAQVAAVLHRYATLS